MAKPLDPKAIEAERQTSSRAERREQKRRQMQDEIRIMISKLGVTFCIISRRRSARLPLSTVKESCGWFSTEKARFAR